MEWEDKDAVALYTAKKSPMQLRLCGMVVCPRSSITPRSLEILSREDTSNVSEYK